MPNERAGYSSLKVDQTRIKPVIFENSDFSMYKLKVEGEFESWQSQVLSTLRNLSVGCKPKEIIIDLSEGILSAFSQIELIDNYDVYQNLMNYWSETMQDDIYLIAANGWKVELNINKNKKGKETSWDCALIPKNLRKCKISRKKTLEKTICSQKQRTILER